MKGFLIALIAVLFSVTEFTTATNAQPKNYSGPVAQQPVRTKGSFWRYEGKVRGKPTYFRRVFDGVEQINGKTYHAIQMGSTRRYETPELNFAFNKNTRGEVTNLSEPPLANFNWPLWVGKEWSQKVSHTISGSTYNYEQDFKVLAYEKVHTSAGEFEAFKLSRAVVNGSTYEEYWYSPQVRYIVKFEGSSPTGGEVEFALTGFELK